MPIVGWIIGIKKKSEHKSSAGSECLKLGTIGFLYGILGLILAVPLNIFGGAIGLFLALTYSQSQYKKIISGEIIWEG